jgi:hypothetical protein
MSPWRTTLNYFLNFTLFSAEIFIKTTETDPCALVGARIRPYEYEAKAILKKFGMAASQGPWLS